jgi:hypothetical protein
VTLRSTGDPEPRPRWALRAERYAGSVSAMLPLAQADPDKVRIALSAWGDQVLAALRDSLRPGAKNSDRIVALVDLDMHAAFEMLLRAARSEDRIVFAEAEMKAWAVAEALNRGAEAALMGDREALMASLRDAEAILGLDATSAQRR